MTNKKLKKQLEKQLKELKKMIEHSSYAKENGLNSFDDVINEIYDFEPTSYSEVISLIARYNAIKNVLDSLNS